MAQLTKEQQGVRQRLYKNAVEKDMFTNGTVSYEEFNRRIDHVSDYVDKIYQNYKDHGGDFGSVERLRHHLGAPTPRQIAVRATAQKIARQQRQQQQRQQKEQQQKFLTPLATAMRQTVDRNKPSQTTEIQAPYRPQSYVQDVRNMRSSWTPSETENKAYQQAGQNLAKSASQEYDRLNTPIVRNRHGEPIIGGKTEEQFLNEQRPFIDKALDEASIDKEVGGLVSQKESEGSNAAFGNESRLTQMLNNLTPEQALVSHATKSQEYNKFASPEALWKAVQSKGFIDKIAQSAFTHTDENGKRQYDDFVINGARERGISPDEYVKYYGVPALSERIASSLQGRLNEKYKVKDYADYIGRNLTNSIVGYLALGATTTRQQRQLSEQAVGEYEPTLSLAGKLGGFAANVLGQTPEMFVGGMGGGAALKASAKFVGTKVLGRVAPRAGVLLANGGNSMLASASTDLKTAFGTWALRHGYEGTAMGAGMAPFMAVDAMRREISTGENPSFASVAKAGWEGSKEGFKMGFALGFAGIPGKYLKAAAGKIDNGVLRTAAKTTAQMASFGIESGVFTAQSYLSWLEQPHAANEKFNWTNNLEESMGQVLVFKVQGALTHYAPSLPKRVEAYNKANPDHKTNAAKMVCADFVNLFSGKTGKTPVAKVTGHDKHVIETATGKTIEQLGASPETLNEVFSNKQIPWNVRQKIALDIFNTMEVSRPRTQSWGISPGEKGGYYLTEYDREGNPIEQHPFKSMDEHDAVLGEIVAKRDNDDLLSYIGMFRMGLADRHDDMSAEERNSEVFRSTVTAMGFDYDLMQTSKEYDDMVRARINGDDKAQYERERYRQERSLPTRDEEIISQFAAGNGMTDSDVRKIIFKDPLSRTEDEQALIDRLSQTMHDEIFRQNELHRAQSAQDGAMAADKGVDITDPETAGAIYAGLSKAVKDSVDKWNKLCSEIPELAAIDGFENGRPSDNPNRDNVSPEQFTDNILDSSLSDADKKRAVEAFAEMQNAGAVLDGFTRQCSVNLINTRVTTEAQVFSSSKDSKVTDSGGNDLSGSLVSVTFGETSPDGTPKTYYVKSSSGVRFREDGSVDRDNSDPHGMVVVVDSEGNVTTRSAVDPDIRLMGTESQNDFAERRSSELASALNESFIRNTAQRDPARGSEETGQQESNPTDNPNQPNSTDKTDSTNPTDSPNPPTLHIVADTKTPDGIIANMHENAPEAPFVELTPENWTAQFGERGEVSTPIGVVKMGDGQYLKLIKNKRTDQLGMIKPTLENPDIILETYDPKEGADRDTKYLFVKSFRKADGTKYTHFESVSVRQGDMEVVTSNHFVREEQLRKRLETEKILWNRFDNGSGTSGESQGLDNQSGASPTTSGNGSTNPQSISTGKDSETFSIVDDGGVKKMKMPSGKLVEVNSDGYPYYSKAEPADAAAELLNRYKDKADRISRKIEAKIKQYQKELDEANKVKHSTADDDATFDREEDAREQAIKDAQSKLDHWNNIKSEVEKQQEQATKNAEQEAQRQQAIQELKNDSDSAKMLGLNIAGMESLLNDPNASLEQLRLLHNTASKQIKDELNRLRAFHNLTTLAQKAADLGVSVEGLNEAVKNEKMPADEISDWTQKAQKAIDDFNGVQQPYTVGKQVKTKWENAPKIKGRHGSITLADGKKISGTFYIASIYAATPSHDPFNNFESSEGFPFDENGKNVNDRNYKDKMAQSYTEKIAGSYDWQAGYSVVLDGATLDGNGRVIAGQIAARRGTDAKYQEGLLDNAEGYGTTAEAIRNSGIDHPHLYFVPDEKLPFNTKTFAMFNRDEKKAMSDTEKAIAVGKQLSDADRERVMEIVGGYANFDSFADSASATTEIMRWLQDAGIMGQNELPKYVTESRDSDGTVIHKINPAGKAFIQNILLGTVFDENTIKFFSDDKGQAIKNNLLRALQPIIDNKKLGDYSLSEVIGETVDLLYTAKTSNTKVANYLLSPTISGDPNKKYSPLARIFATAIDRLPYRDAPDMYIKDEKTGKTSLKPEYDDYDFKSLLERYNKNAKPYANPNAQAADMFGNTKPTKKELIKSFLDVIYKQRKSRVQLQTAKNIAKKFIGHKIDVSIIGDEGQQRLDRALADGEDGIRFSRRTKPAPAKTQKVYKLMRLGSDGKLYPLFIDSSEGIELGQWYDADSPGLSVMRKLDSGVWLIDPKTGKATSLHDYNQQHGISKDGRFPSRQAVSEAAANGQRWVSIVDKKTSQKRYGGETRSYYNLGINGAGSVGEFAMRPGWHAGSLPTMRQIGKGKGKNLRDNHFVWVEGEVPADRDYNAEAQANPDHDIPDHIPTDGYYLKSTNANSRAAQADHMGWYVAGAFKPDRIISDREARETIDKWNSSHPDKKVEYDYRRESGEDFDGNAGEYAKKLYAQDREAEEVMRLLNGDTDSANYSENPSAEKDNSLSLQKTQNNGNQRTDSETPQRGGRVGRPYVEGDDGLRLQLERDGGASEKDNGRSRPLTEQIDKENEIAESWASQKGKLMTMNDLFKLGRVGIGGSENDPYYSDDGYVYKMNNMFHNPLLHEYLDRLAYHNILFPDTKYELVGFVKEGHSLFPVVRQKTVKMQRVATEKEIKDYMEAYGYKDLGDGKFDNGQFTVKDVKPKNVLVDMDGKLRIVDAEIEPNKTDSTDKTNPSNRIRNTKFFRTKTGEVYGFVTKEGKIYLDPKHLDPSLPIHEYGHLWAEAVRIKGPKRWAKIVKTVNDAANGQLKPLFDEVRRDDPSLTGDDLAEEVLMRYSGKKGMKLLDDAAKEIWDSGKTVDEKQIAKSAIEKVVGNLKNAIREFWKDVADMLGIRYRNVDDIADHLIYDALTARNPKDFKEAERKDTYEEHKKNIQQDIAYGIADKFQKEGLAAVDVTDLGQQVLDKGEQQWKAMTAKQKRALTTASPTLNGTDQPTVVDSTHGAKVINDLDKLAEDYEFNKSNRTKTFIGDLAAKLEAHRNGSDSEYATFETKNGRIVTIRLANHNARASEFDYHDELDGISIVITAKKNLGLTNDGNAHVKEFFYNAIKLRRADGKPLAQIIRDIRQALYSGEYKDHTGLCDTPQEINIPPEVRKMQVYHGSKAIFDAFDSSHIGEGVGDQVHGWGNYVAVHRGVSENYIRVTAPKTTYFHVRGKNLSADEFLDYLSKISGVSKKSAILKKLVEGLTEGRMYTHAIFEIGIEDYKKRKNAKPEVVAGLEKIKKMWDKGRLVDKRYVRDKGYLYTIDIPDNDGHNYLEEQKVMPVEEQRHIYSRLTQKLNNAEEGEYAAEEMLPAKLQKLVRKRATGKDVYWNLVKKLGTKKEASQLLSELGYKGVHYYGRRDGECYVVFNDSDLNITNRIKFFRTASGEVYGFVTKEGKIYLDPKHLDPSLPIHEYGHLWAEAVRIKGPKRWEKIVKTVNDAANGQLKPLFDEVRRDDPSLTGDDFAEEVLMRYSGKKGMKLLDDAAKEIWDSGKTVDEKQIAKSAIEKVVGNLKNAIREFWKDVADMLGIRYRNVDDIADHLIYDALTAKNPREGEKISDKTDKPNKPDSTNPSDDSIKPVGNGDFGPVYDQFKGKPKEAVSFLLAKKGGEATGALRHKDIGDIDLVYGEEGSGHSDGYGLAKLAKYHPEVLDNLQEILDDMHVTKRTDNRVQLESDTHQATVRLTWNDKKKTWLLTAFEKKSSAPDNTTDTAKTSQGGKGNGTATSQSTASNGKDNDIPLPGQEKQEKKQTKYQWKSFIGRNGETFDINDDIARTADENWDAAKKYLDNNPDAKVADLQRGLKIGWKAANFIHDRYVRENKEKMVSSLLDSYDTIKRNIEDLYGEGREKARERLKDVTSRLLDLGVKPDDMERRSKVADLTDEEKKVFDDKDKKLYQDIYSKTEKAARHYSATDMKKAIASNEAKIQETTDPKQRLALRHKNDIYRAELKKREDFARKYHIANGRTTLDDVVRLFGEMNMDSSLASVFERVVKTCRLFSPEIKFTKQLGGKVAGNAAADGIVKYNLDFFSNPNVSNQEKASVLVHELVHNATLYALEAYKLSWSDKKGRNGISVKEMWGKLSKGQQKAVEEIYDIYRKIESDREAFPDKKRKGGKQYGLSNAFEMVAEIYSNSEFREQAKKKNLWTKLKDAIVRFFTGAEPGAEQTTVMKALSERIDYLLEHPNIEVYKDMRGHWRKRRSDIAHNMPDELADRKQQQLDIINRTNPMLDDYHVGVRSVDDILTFDEAVDYSREENVVSGGDKISAYPDVSDEMLERAQRTGKITVYSSHPIKDGVFVSPSLIMAREYAGGRGSKVYSKRVPVEDVAWLDADEGQYARVDEAPSHNSETAKGDVPEELRKRENILKEKYKDTSSRDLFVSLKDKQGEDYYDTITELARRTAKGETTIHRLGDEIEGGAHETVPEIIGRLAAGRYPQFAALSPGMSEKSWTAQRGRNGEENTGLFQDKVVSDTEKTIERWARDNGCFYEYKQLVGNSLDEGIWNDGFESETFRSKDGKYVIKATHFMPDSWGNDILHRLDQIRTGNKLLPNEWIEVLGYGYDSEGRLSVITRQPLIEGKTVMEANDFDLSEGQKEIDTWLESQGFKKKIIKNPEYPEFEGYDIFTNGKFTIVDASPSNVIIDKDSKYHIIDCEVLPVGYEKIDRFEVTDVNALGQEAEDYRHIAGRLETKDNETLGNEAPEELRRSLNDRVRSEGLDKTLGHDNYNALMRGLHINLSRNQDYKDYVREHLWSNKLDVYKTAAEFLAQQAGKPGKVPMWQDVQQRVNDSLKKAGIDIELGLRQTKYLAWLAQHPSDRANPLKEAERIAMERKIMSERIEQPVSDGEFRDFGTDTPETGTPRTSPAETVPPVREMSDEEVRLHVQRDKAQVRFASPGTSIPPTSTPTQHFAKADYESRLSGWEYIMKEAHIDSHQAEEEAARAITGEKGDMKGKLKENEDWLSGENQLSSLLDITNQNFKRNIMEPLEKVIKSVLPNFGKKAGEAMRGLQVHMITKSALERNRVLFVRDYADKLQKDGDKNAADTARSFFKNEKDRLDRDLDDGTIDLSEYYMRLDDVITQITGSPFYASEHDYSGLTTLYKNAKEMVLSCSCLFMPHVANTIPGSILRT